MVVGVRADLCSRLFCSLRRWRIVGDMLRDMCWKMDWLKDDERRIEKLEGIGV